IREEDKAAFADHETWSEEADKLDRGGSAGLEGRERRRVAVVVSADIVEEEGEEGLHAVSIVLFLRFYLVLLHDMGWRGGWKQEVANLSLDSPSCRISPRTWTFRLPSCTYSSTRLI